MACELTVITDRRFESGGLAHKVDWFTKRR